MASPLIADCLAALPRAPVLWLITKDVTVASEPFATYTN